MECVEKKYIFFFEELYGFSVTNEEVKKTVSL